MKFKLLPSLVSFFSNPIRLRLLLFAILIAFVVLAVVSGGRVHIADGIPGGGIP